MPHVAKKIGERIGITVQELRKYEKGHNLIGVSRLQAIADTLDVTIKFFSNGSSQRPASTRSMVDKGLFGFLQTARAVRLVKALHKIKSDESRERLVGMAEQVANNAND